MKKGICQATFPSDVTTRGCIEGAAEAGYDGIELILEDPDSMQLDLVADNDTVRRIAETVGMADTREGAVTPDTSDEELVSLREKAESEGIEIHSIATILHFYFPFSSPDPELADRAVELGKVMVRQAELVGADTVLIVPGVVGSETSYDRVWENAQTNLKRLVEFAESKQIHLGIEDVWNDFLYSPLEMKRFVEQLDSPNLGVYFDIGNVLEYGYPHQWIEILGDHIKKLHCKDYIKSIGDLNGFTYLLQGDVDWERVMNSLEDIGYEGYITVEVPPYRHVDPEKAVYDSSSSLDKILSMNGG